MNNLFDPEFYPTPPEVIIRMAEPYAERLGTATILEPSAGSGAILDYITREGIETNTVTSWGNRYGYTAKANPKKVYAIERNPDLRTILQQKGYRVIASDFLAFRPEHRFDLILQNPPFSDGDKHLLHAWDILQDGDIACLLNAETVRNPCTASRKRLARIIEENGSVELLGQAFVHADNPTDVEIALVRLHKKPAADPFRFDTDGFRKDDAPDFGSLAKESDQVAVNDKLGTYIRCWEKTKESATEFIRAFARFKFYVTSFLPKPEHGAERGDNIIEHILSSLKELRYDSTSMTDVYNDFLDTTKASAWNAILDQIGLEKYMTNGLRKKLDEFRTAQGAMEISRENIWALFGFIMKNINLIMDQSVTEVYDLFTRYYKGNTSYEEGWKTNKRFKCNRKVILPEAARSGYKPSMFGYDEFFSAAHDSRLNDIDKALCWLSGRNFDTMDNHYYDCTAHHRTCDPERATVATALQCIRVGDQDWHESAFFRIKAFKKGTVHLEFKDEDLWNRFCIAVNEGKNQIGMSE